MKRRVQVVGKPLGKKRRVAVVLQRMTNPCARIIVVVVLRHREAIDGIVGRSRKSPIQIREHVMPFTAHFRFPLHHVVPPAAVARPYFRGPVVREIDHVHFGRSGIKIGLIAEVLIKQRIHNYKGRVIAFFDPSIVRD